LDEILANRNRVAVVNIIAPDFNPGNKNEITTRPHEIIEKSENLISDGTEKVINREQNKIKLENENCYY